MNLVSDSITFTAETGTSATLTVRGERITVSADAPVVVPLSGRGPKLEGIPRLQAGERRMDGTLITASVPAATTPPRPERAEALPG